MRMVGKDSAHCTESFNHVWRTYDHGNNSKVLLCSRLSFPCLVTQRMVQTVSGKKGLIIHNHKMSNTNKPPLYTNHSNYSMYLHLPFDLLLYQWRPLLSMVQQWSHPAKKQNAICNSWVSKYMYQVKVERQT